MVTNIYELLDNINTIDKEVAFDILKRIIDWIRQGNSIEGAYIQQQIRYFNMVVEYEKNNINKQRPRNFKFFK